MAKLTYLTIASLDGYMADEDGDFGWARPDEEVHTFVNDLERGVGTHLYGRRMYETMAVWETDPSLAADSATAADYARIWLAAEKVVYSKTLESAVTARTTIERDFDPDDVREMKASAAADLSIGGAELAAAAFAAGLIDECHCIVAPAIVGGGKRALPDGMRLDLELEDERRFAGGMVYLRYRVLG